MPALAIQIPVACLVLKSLPPTGRTRSAVQPPAVLFSRVKNHQRRHWRRARGINPSKQSLWLFERVSRGVYKLTAEGQTALLQYSEAVAHLRPVAATAPPTSSKGEQGQTRSC